MLYMNKSAWNQPRRRLGLSLSMESAGLENEEFPRDRMPAGFCGKLCEIARFLVAVVLILCATGNFSAVLGIGEGCLVRFCAFLLNHHGVFLIGNTIIMLLFASCFQIHSGDAEVTVNCYDDYLRVPAISLPLATDTRDSGGAEEEKMVVSMDTGNAVTQCDDVTASNLRQAKEGNYRKTIAQLYRTEIENLSSEEFRRIIDAFIDKHWSSKKSKPISNPFAKLVNYKLQEVS